MNVPGLDRCRSRQKIRRELTIALMPVLAYGFALMVDHLPRKNRKVDLTGNPISSIEVAGKPGLMFDPDFFEEIYDRPE